MELRQRCVRDGVRVVLAGVHAQPLEAMRRSGLVEKFGVEKMSGTLEEALELARG